jgi:hypothetical protein
VETINFTDKTSFMGSGENLRLVERFPLASANLLLYEFTVDDSGSFSGPWPPEVPMLRSDQPLYEYAYHEGNYDMRHILEVARASESPNPK